MSGLGLQPLGTSPYGLGTPNASPPLGGTVLALPDGRGQGTCRKIDLKTRQYVRDQYGRNVGETTVRQLVQMVATTTLKSSAIANLGTDFSTLKDITSNFVSRVQVIYTTAYARLVARKLIVLRAIDVTVVPPSRALVVVKFTDLSTGEDDEVIA